MHVFRASNLLGAVSSVGLERLVYTQKVGSSNLSPPTSHREGHAGWSCSGRSGPSAASVWRGGLYGGSGGLRTGQYDEVASFFVTVCFERSHVGRRSYDDDERSGAGPVARQVRGRSEATLYMKGTGQVQDEGVGVPHQMPGDGMAHRRVPKRLGVEQVSR